MAVAGAISEVCDIRGWTLAALNVRTNHLHAVVAANTAPERIMLDFKSYATRRLRRDGLSRPGSPVWARGGSTKYLWQHAHVAAAIRYATFDQGEDIGGLRTFDETSPC
jgi:REP element-mobilizing transposase RayT